MSITNTCNIFCKYYICTTNTRNIANWWFLWFYSVVAKDYFGQPNVCLLYDKNGFLAQYASGIVIEADASSKNIITRHPTQENKYWLFSRNKLGKLFRYEIAITTNAGVTTTMVMAKLEIAATENVGAHFTAVEDRGEGTVYLYATRNNTSTQKAELFVVSMGAIAVAVLPTIAQLPYTETDLYHGGELQISPDGKQLLWYHLGQRAAFFDYQNLKPHSFILGDNIAGVVANPTGTAIIPEFIGTDPNPLRSEFTLRSSVSIDIDKVGDENSIYFTQKNITNNNIVYQYKNGILQTPTTTSVGNVRRGKSGEVRQSVGLGTGLPVQVHTITNVPLSAQARTSASRLLRVRNYELKDHLGNVRVIVSDQKQADASAKVQSYSNYYAFGMEMPGMQYADNQAYRYGYNGKEKENELNEQNYDFGARIYDSRIGKWLSTDPLEKKFISNSPYHFCLNNPIIYIDPDGKDVILKDSKGKIVATITKAGTIIAKGREKAEILTRYNEAKKYLAEVGDNTLKELEDHKSELIIQHYTYPVTKDNFTKSGVQSGVDYDKVTSFEDANKNGKFEAGEKVLAAKYFNKSGIGIIKWNFAQGLIDGNSNRHSPALVLLHEAKHAKHYVESLVTFLNNRNTKAGAYTNNEEKRTIDEVNLISKLLHIRNKENDGGNGTRMTHTAPENWKSNFQAAGTTSIKDSKYTVKKP